MSHVDEGMLHAYLDALERGVDAGALSSEEQLDVEAHIAACMTCAVAFTEARALRARAGSVLASAAPAIDMPPFESITAHAPARPARRRWVPLAWAASLVMAVGSGWMASELWRSGAVSSQPELRASEQAAPPPAAAAALEGALDESVTAASGEPERAADATVGTSAPPVVAEGRAETRARVEEAAGAAAPAAETGEKLARTEVPIAEPELMERQQDLVTSKAVPPPAAAPAVGAVTRNAAPLPQATRLQMLESGESVDTLHYAGEADVTWRPVSAAVAEQRLGGELERLAEARLLSVELAESGQVRTRQQLPSGSEAEVVQWRESGGAAAPRDAVVVDGLRIVRQGIATDGRGWVLLARGEERIALKAPPGVLPLALLARLERQP